MPLDPKIKRFLDKIYANGYAEINRLTPSQIREYLRLPKLITSQVPFEDFHIKEKIIIRCFTPLHLSSIVSSGVIFLSANGFVIDTFEHCNDYCSLLANKLNMRIFIISHGLSPEYKFPYYLHESANAIVWIIQNASLLKMNEKGIALWGESAGGNVAAALTHHFKENNLNIIRHQTLIYPLLDLCSQYPSKKAFAKKYLLDETFTQYLEDLVLPSKQYRYHPRVSPLLSKNFNGLPPLTLITAEYDPLRDEAHAYASKLKKAKVKVNHKEFSGMIHGFLRFYNKIAAANLALDFACEQLNTALVNSSHSI